MTAAFRVIICGTRTWADIDRISDEISFLRREYRDRLTIIHGAATGVDSIAGAAATDMGIRVEAYPADWATYGKAAGPIRNREMLRTGVNRVVAFWDGRSKGTQDMIAIAKTAGVEVEIHYGMRTSDCE